MSDLVPYVAPPMPTPMWVATMAPAAELARQIAGTEFVPSSMRGAPAKVAACIMFGDELGLGPMQSLAKIDVIEGRPAPKAELARALVLGAGHELLFEETSNSRCVVAGRRRGSDTWQRVTWTMDDAKRAGLDGKTNWRKWPRAMLAARASAELVRMAFPDCLGGITLFAEEIESEEITVPAVAKIAATAAPSTRARKLSAPVVQSDTLPPLPDEIEIVIVDAEIVDAEIDPFFAITDAQIKKLVVMMKVVGVADRESKLRLIGSVVGRQVGSSKDLTVAEASMVIEALTAVQDGRAQLTIGSDGSPTVEYGGAS